MLDTQRPAHTARVAGLCRHVSLAPRWLRAAALDANIPYLLA
jgi:hypothetical protein